MKLTILTISKRLGGLDVLYDSLSRQTILPRLIQSRDVEWIFVDEYARDQDRQGAFAKITGALGLDGDRSRHVYPSDYDPPRYGKLSRANNSGLSLARGEYIFFLNDYTWLADDTLEKIWALKDEVDQPALLTGINHRACVPQNTPETVLPESADRSYSIFTKPFEGKDWGFPDVPLSWIDSRMHDYKGVEHLLTKNRIFSRNMLQWEANVALAPTQMLQDIGGWDEDIDFGYSYDNQSVAARFLKAYPYGHIVIDYNIVTLSLEDKQYFPVAPDFEAATMRNRLMLEAKFKSNGNGHAPKTTFSKSFEVESIPPYSTPVHLRLVRSQLGVLSIAFYIPDVGHWRNLSPDTLDKRALGGRETAVVRLSQELSALGWTVTIYAPTTIETRDQLGIEWKFVQHVEKNPACLAGFDVAVSIERAAIFRKGAARLNILHEQCAHMWDTGFDRHVDHYFLLSDFQQHSLIQSDPSINPDKCVVFGNGIDLERFDSIDVPTIPGRLVYSSSPDRGLHHLIHWWPVLKQQHPELTLKVFYNIDAILAHKWHHEMRAEWARIIDQGRHLDGVEYVGPVDQKTLAREQKQAQLWVYPCDPVQETETFCITALEMAAARVPILISPADCLEGVYGRVAWLLPLPIQDALWCQGIGDLLTKPDLAQKHVAAARRLAEEYTWKRIAARWDRFLRKRLELSDPDAILELAEDATYDKQFAEVR